jgi:ZIP family zinc transporter
MLKWFSSLDVVYQALIATLFTYLMTALGASLVFFFKKIKESVLKLMLGFASGVMISASFFSLILPALEISNSNGDINWLVVSIGFGVGGLFLFLADKIVPHIHFFSNEKEGLSSKLKRNILLVFSITLHNIPEGLAVGVAFGLVIKGDIASSLAALSVAIGIGIQNFPEGAAVSIPLYNEGVSKGKSFFHGQLSGLVEPIAGVLGALLVSHMHSILPYALGFAAGAMIYVVIEELVPEATKEIDGKHSHMAVFGCMLGFIIMMILDVALG